MFRRRSPQPVAAAAPAAPSPGSAGGADVDDLAGSLADDGWILPRGLAADAAPGWTLVGTVASPTATAVDPTGLVVGEGWSLDWWIGADDRWHLPVREAAVRQQLVGEAPVVETLLRIPGGDAAHRTYGFRSPRAVGDEWVAVEIKNATPVPFAVALVVRPVVADGVGEVSEITVEPVDGGTGREAAHLVRIDGRPAIVLPRRPARLAAGNRDSGDVAEQVTNGDAVQQLVAAHCPDGLATLALVLPLAHTAVLRVAIPVGDVGDAPLAYPAVVPDAATVALGWDVHRRGPRFEIPEPRLSVAVERARAQIHLAHDSESVRRDGHRSPDLDPGATEVLLAAFDLLDRPADVGAVVARWTDRLTEASPEVDALVLTVVARHWLVHRDDALLQWVLPEVAAAVERIDRADRRSRLAGAAVRRRTVEGLRAAAEMLARAGQPDAGRRVADLSVRIGTDLSTPTPVSAAERLLVAGAALAAGDAAGLVVLDAELPAASPTGTWPGPGRGGRPTGHDLAAAAALVVVARNMLVAERPDGLALVPVHPDGWYGGGIELHDAPTTFGRISYAIRWHGTRPALLWELDPHPSIGPVRICVPDLDPVWSTTELRGDALLGDVLPPAGLEQVTLVSEHPDIDPEMRRAGTAPSQEQAAAIPDGGSFS